MFPTDNTYYDSPKNYDCMYKYHEFYSKDHTPLRGLYIKTSKKCKGLIVIVNGMSENMSNRFKKWLWAVDGGYDIFTFDYRGFGDSKADPDFLSFLNDVKSALEYAHSLDKEKKIILVGQSMGGTFVIDTLASENYSYVSLGVIDSTFTSFSSLTMSHMASTIVLIPFIWIPYVSFPDEFDSINHIKEVKTPLLFVSGDNDYIVNWKNSEKLYDEAETKKALWLVKNASHAQSFENLNVRGAFLKLLTNVKSLTKEQKRYF